VQSSHARYRRDRGEARYLKHETRLREQHSMDGGKLHVHIRENGLKVLFS
jgi:hypothetical protein